MGRKANEDRPEARLLRRKRREEHERNWIPYSPKELAWGIVNVFRSRRTGPISPEPLDEFGLPRSWRHDEVNEAMLEHSRAHWGLFEKWCESNGRTAFPADPFTCLDFLRANWDLGPELHETWRAIHERHDAYYRHSDALPVEQMRVYLGLDVLPDGTIVIRPVDPES